MKAIILRGIPGAGKTTWARVQPWAENSHVVSADYFFMKSGTYKFDPSKLAEAHSQCFRDFIEHAQALWNSKSKLAYNCARILVVDNTNLSVEEIAPYYAAATAYDLEVEIVSFTVSPKLAVRNVHGVELPVLERMCKKFLEMRLPSFWNVKHSLQVVQ